MMDNTNTLETDALMSFESFRVGIVTLRVSQAKKIPNSSSNPWYVNTNQKINTLCICKCIGAMLG